MLPNTAKKSRPLSLLREFLDHSASGGLVLMPVAALALVTANTSLAPIYFQTLHGQVGPLSVEHWINDGLMAVFFLFVGLEIKREVLDGQLETWARRILPGAAALGGMAAPAVVFMLLNWNDPATTRGWAIPAATDIAFALAVLTLLGSRIPVSLRIFLTALAIIDDLGAVAIIAFFYTSNVSFLYLGLAVTITALLANMNRIGIVRLWPYLFLGAVLWFCVFRSGIHATVAGVVLAFTIPLHATRGHPDSTTSSPLHRLEHGLQKWVAFLIIPIFGFANAGVSVAGLTPEILTNRLALGSRARSIFGKAPWRIRKRTFCNKHWFCRFAGRVDAVTGVRDCVALWDWLYDEPVHRCADLPERPRSAEYGQNRHPGGLGIDGFTRLVCTSLGARKTVNKLR